MSVFGYVDDQDESLKSKSGGKFGLNNGNITKLEYNPNGGSDGAAADCVDYTVTIGEREFRSRIFDVTGELFKGDDKIGPEDPAYKGLYDAEITQRMAVVTHAVKSLGVTSDQIKAALATPPADFKGWAEIITSLIPDNFASLPVDVFLEYQWNIKGDNDRTFLQLPTNMKGGRFLCASIAPVGSWKEVKSSEGLVYKDDAENSHVFDRNANYMGDKKAYQQIDGEDNAPSNIEGGSPKPAGEKDW